MLTSLNICYWNIQNKIFNFSGTDAKVKIIFYKALTNCQHISFCKRQNKQCQTCFSDCKSGLNT